MLSAKNASANNFYSSNQLKSAQSFSSPKVTSHGILTTEDQQQRIRNLINEVRRGGPMTPSATIIPQSELARMKNSAAILTKEELLQQKKIFEEQTEKQQAAAKAKKQKMMEIEAERRKNLPPTEIELEKKFKDESLRSKAKKLLNEEKDDVKTMNQMMLYAKVVTIRDKQLEEKKTLKDHAKAEERRRDLIMELERLNKIKYYEDVDKQKKDEQKKSASATIQQIKERELERQRRQDDIEKEGQAMLRRIKEVQEEDKKDNLLKKEHQRVTLDSILESNKLAINKKQLRIKEEREEEERIAKYLIERAQKEAEYQAEQKRIQDEKEREVHRLRELQEKASDRAAEIDALRAKRAMEFADRQARLKEKREAEARAKINQDLWEARQKQSLEKEKRLQEQAKLERDEFQRIVQNQKMERDLELRMETEKVTRINEHADQLKKQIALNEEKKKQAKREFLEEGKLIKDKLNDEKYLLEDIKSEKLTELNSLGIANKYSSELARKRIII